jgi:hypothetical protein
MVNVIKYFPVPADKLARPVRGGVACLGCNGGSLDVHGGKLTNFNYRAMRVSTMGECS